MRSNSFFTMLTPLFSFYIVHCPTSFSPCPPPFLSRTLLTHHSAYCSNLPKKKNKVEQRNNMNSMLFFPSPIFGGNVYTFSNILYLSTLNIAFNDCFIIKSNPITLFNIIHTHHMQSEWIHSYSHVFYVPGL